jgi:hypothetical protein
MSSKLLDASELEGLKPTSAIFAHNQRELEIASLTRRVPESNMPNVCYSNEHLKQTCSEQVIKRSTNAHGYQ